MQASKLKIRRALLTVSDKEGVVELGQALAKAGAELVATGKTAEKLREAGLKIRPIEEVSGSPEAFQGRMKTLSFPVCSGILYRRGDEKDEADLKKLGFLPIDCVVVNFYPFEAAAARPGISRKDLIEEVDIGGPTLVRSAAKNSPDVLVLTDPRQYRDVISSLSSEGAIPHSQVQACAEEAWKKVAAYDNAIEAKLSSTGKLPLRYGENPHQKGHLEVEADSPIAWPSSAESQLTSAELSYNNILDLSAAYALASDLLELERDASSVVIIKHNNPCGVASIPGKNATSQLEALKRAWEGDPTSAFGGVLVFTDPIAMETAEWLASRFVECVAAPDLLRNGDALRILGAKRKNLKAVAIRRFGRVPKTSTVAVPGGKLIQSTDLGLAEELKWVTNEKATDAKSRLARFGIAVCRILKSNAVALVREIPSHAGSLQLVGAGQGQPNRIEALQALAIPRAHAVLDPQGAKIADCILVSDAFFPFRDTVDAAAKAGIKMIIQPGGSIKDAESVQACNEAGIAMAFTGTRHFRH